MACLCVPKDLPWLRQLPPGKEQLTQLLLLVLMQLTRKICDRWFPAVPAVSGLQN
jgi:hypothetical protein